MATTTDRAILGFTAAVAEVVNAGGDATRQAESLLRLLGWLPPPGVDLSRIFALDLTTLISRARAIANSTPADRKDDLLMAQRFAALLVSVKDVVTEIDDLTRTLPQSLAAAGDYLAKSRIDKDLPQRLLDFLLVNFVAAHSPFAYRSLALLGIFTSEAKPEDPSVYQAMHTRVAIAYPRVGLLFDDPSKLVEDVYGWRTSSFSAGALLMNLSALLRLVGVDAGVSYLDGALETRLDGGTGAPADPSPHLLASFPLAIGPAAASVGISVHRLRSSAAGATDAGLELIPFARGSTAAQIPLSDRAVLEIVGDVNAGGGVALLLRPGSAEVKTGVFAAAGGGALAGEISAGVRFGDGKTPLRILSAPGGTYLEADAIAVRGGLDFLPAGPDPFMIATVSGARLTVRPTGDGFLARVFPKEGLTVDVETAIRWSVKDGLRFAGGAGLEVVIPVGKSVGPLDLHSIDIALSASGNGVRFVAGAIAAITIGPVRGSIDRVGVSATLAPQRGNLGPADLSIAFKPPTGVGLSVDSAAVKGGGFLSFDPDRGQYSGALHLDIEGISLNAIGILSTRLPGGQEGFSLLILISASGFTPVQLGFGFSLTGVGGLIGINRDVSTPALQSGLKTHALDSIWLSKDDPVPRAGQIIQQLQTVFPPTPDSYVFGPTAQISWGTPTIVTIDIALLIRLPAPVRLYVLGRLRAFMPTEKQALVRLNMDVLGVIDFGQGTVAVDAILYDSKILAFALTGGMALRASWGRDPGFALAVGGFNPRFVKPNGFPDVDRLALTLSTGDNPRLRVEAYLALTSNTVQFGANADFRVALGDLAIAGGFGFDALIQLSPFEFVVDIRASLALTYKGASLMAVAINLTLSGPAPMRARGTVSFSILFLTISKSFDVTLVQGQPPPAPDAIDLLADALKAELSDPRNWVAGLPDGGQMVVIAASPAPADAELLCHPLGRVAIHQRVAPFDRDLDRFGPRPLKGSRHFSINDVTVNGVSQRTRMSKVYDLFAPAQFREMSDDEKLKAPSFERMVAGVELDGGIASGVDVPKKIGYETIVIRGEASERGTTFSPPADRVPTLAQGGAAAEADTRTTGRAKYRNAKLGIEVRESEYVVATKSGLQKAADGDGTYTGATEALRSYVAAHPREAGDVQIVRAREVV